MNNLFVLIQVDNDYSGQSWCNGVFGSLEAAETAAMNCIMTDIREYMDLHDEFSGMTFDGLEDSQKRYVLDSLPSDYEIEPHELGKMSHGNLTVSFSVLRDVSVPRMQRVGC